MINGISGLTKEQVKQKHSLGLSNQTIDTYSPSKFTIIRRNTVNIINAVLVPLILALVSFELWREVTVFSVFVFVNSFLSALDELRMKKRLDELHRQFQQTAHVIRDGEIVSIPVSEVVKGDFVRAREGEGIIADGEVVYEDFLQIDQAMLTGESNYIKKEKGEEVLSGSFVVTGECIYKVKAVGKNNYLNKLGAEATRYSRGTSGVQRAGNSLIIFFVVSALITGAINFYATQDQDSVDMESRLLALTSIVALIIPQTLIFLFTLSFSISVTKLSNKGILVQKKGAIDDLANIDVVCMDKTGTITTNKMTLNQTKYWNVTEKEIGEVYKSLTKRIVGKNKTQEVLEELFFKYKEKKLVDFDQVPFNSNIKYSLIQAAQGERYKRVVFGAPSVLLKNVKTKKLRDDIAEFVETSEAKGFRVLIGLYSQHNKKPSINKLEKTDSVACFVIEETLNLGIEEVIQKLKNQNIDIKVISGDSINSVKKIVEKIGIFTNDIVDLSETNLSIEELAIQKTVFTRARPEDKLSIIKALQEEGLRVAMIGDGVNDVLGMKLSEVGIAMESGSKITRDIADIVLLENDYKKIPEIFYEGDNLIFNMKISSKMFLAKAITTILIANVFSLVWRIPLPILPSSTLVFSFLGNSLPSYIVALTRQQVNNTKPFLREILESAIPAGFMYGILLIYLFLIARDNGYDTKVGGDLRLNTTLTMGFLAFNISYALYLLFIARKIKNLGVILYIFALLFVTGTAATTLPIEKVKDGTGILGLNNMFYGVILYSIVLALTALKLVWKNKRLRKFTALIIFPGSLVFLIFPFKEYYALEAISDGVYIQILLATIVGFLSLFLLSLRNSKY